MAWSRSAGTEELTQRKEEERQLRGEGPLAGRWQSGQGCRLVTTSSPLWLQKIPKRPQDLRSGTQQATLSSLIAPKMWVSRREARQTH